MDEENGEKRGQRIQVSSSSEEAAAKREQEQPSEAKQAPAETPSPSEQAPDYRDELEKEKKKTQELTKRMMYLQADIMNLQKQSDKRVTQAREDASMKYLLELASLLEDLERALSATSEGSSRAIRDGLSMLISRIDSTLRSESVERIKVGAGIDLFDPRLHEAVAYSHAEGKKDGCILSVVSNGYSYKGKVIKPVLVEVARQTRSAGGQLHQKNQRVTNEDSAREEEEIQLSNSASEAKKNQVKE